MKTPESKSRGSSTGYRVEVRDTIFSGYNPIMLEDGMVTDKWREVSVSTNRFAGAPLPPHSAIISLPSPRCDEAARSRLLDYPAAVAFAHWLVALHPFSQLRCRIVTYDVEWTSIVTRKGIVDEPEIVTEASPEKHASGYRKNVKPEEDSP